MISAEMFRAQVVLRLIREGEIVFPPSAVDRTIRENRLFMELPTDRRRLADILQADALVSGELLAADVDHRTLKISVEGRIRRTDSLGMPLAEADAKVVTSAKPGYRGEPEPLIEEALSQLAARLYDAMNQVSKTEGIVRGLENETDLVLGLSEEDGVRPGARVRLMKGKEYLGIAEIVEVEPWSSRARMVETVAGKRPAPNDRAFLIYNPPPPPPKAFAYKARKWLTKVLIAGAIVWGIKELSEKKEDPGGFTLTAQAKEKALPADGVSTTTIEVTVKTRASGEIVPDGTEVKFSTTSGALIAVTNTEGGVASATLRSDPQAGTATVTAQVGSSKTTIEIAFVELQLRLRSDATEAVADGESSIKLTLEVKDINGNPVADDTDVAFSAEKGSIIEASRTVKGVASATYVAPRLPAATTDTVTVQVGSATSTLTITLTPIQGEVLLLFPEVTSAPADGATKVKLTASMSTKSGSPVTDGTLISFTTTLGTVDASCETNLGSCTVSLSSSAAGTARVIATAGELTTQTQVVFTQTKVTLRADHTSTTAGSQVPVIFIATVTNAETGAVLSGETVDFAADRGTLSSPSATTDGSGQAQVILTVPDTSGPILVTATAKGITASYQLSVVPSGLAAIELSASPAAVPADGTSHVIVTATATDAFNNLVADGTVIAFSVSGHPDVTLFPTEVRTTLGTAKTTMTVGTTPKVVTVSACHTKADGKVICENINITIGTELPSFLVLSASRLNIRGWDVVGNQSSIRADVFDANRNPVPDGTVVVFKTDGGRIDTPCLTQGGQCEVDLTGTGEFPIGEAGVLGQATVTAESGSIVGKIVVIMSGRPVFAAISSTGSGGTVTVFGRVFDVNENPVVEGLGVDLSTTAGTFSNKKSFITTTTFCAENDTQNCRGTFSETLTGDAGTQATVCAQLTALSGTGQPCTTFTF